MRFCPRDRGAGYGPLSVDLVGRSFGNPTDCDGFDTEGRQQ